jgi:hypothetical protein
MLKRRVVHLWALGPSLDLDPTGGSRCYVILVEPSVRMRGPVILILEYLKMIRVRIGSSHDSNIEVVRL